MFRNRVWVALGLWMLAAISCSIGGGGAPSVEKVTVATALDKDYKAIESTATYTPTQTFSLSVKVSNIKENSKLKAVWSQGDNTIKEYTYTSDKAGSGYVGFTLEPKDIWAIGKYRAKIYLEDELAETVNFSVVPPKDAIPSQITQVTLAKGIDKNYQPIEPTVTFSSGDKVFVIISGDVGIDSQLRAEWYLNGTLAKEKTSTYTAGENAKDTVVYFGLDAPVPAGTHQVKIYLDGNMARILDFTVMEGAAAIPSPSPLPVPTKTSTGAITPGGNEGGGNTVEVLSHHSYTDHQGRLWVVGEVQNNTGSNLSSLTVAVRLLDANGNVLDSGTISPHTPVIAAGAKIPVGLFWPADNSALQTVDRYRITVEDFQTTDEPVPPSPWVVSGVKSETTDNGDIVLRGELQNQSLETLQQAEVWGAIYDSDGHILGGGMATLPFNKAIAPGESGTIKLTIAGPLENADSYSVVTVVSSEKQAAAAPTIPAAMPAGKAGGRNTSPTPGAILQPTTAPLVPTVAPVLPVASPTPVQPAPEGIPSFATYTHPTWEFSIKYPSTWKIDEQATYVTLETTDSLVGMVFAATTLQGAGATPEQLLAFFVQGMQQQLTDLTVSPGTHDMTLGGEPAVYQDASMTIAGQRGEGEFIATLHNDWGLMIFLFVATGHGNFATLRDTLQTGFLWTTPTAKAAAPTKVATSVPSASPHGQLLYTVWGGPSDQHYGLYLLNLSGGGAKKLADLSSEPSWSPNGRQYVFYHWTDGLYIGNADGSAHKIVADTEAAYPSWSPRGDRIVYSSLLGGGKFNLFYVTNLDGVSEGQKLGPGNRPAWSPDGQHIAYDNCDAQGHCGVWVMNMDGGNPHPLSSDGGGQPSWSPDGRYIAYASPEDGDYEIMVIHANGGGRRQLTHNSGNDALPDWSADGNFIFYRTDQNGTEWAIYQMRSDGSGKRKVIDALVNPNRWQWERMDAR